MYCNNCGYKNDTDSVYCEKCGHKLNTPVITKQDKKIIEDNNKTNIYLIIAIIAITLLLLGIIILGISNKDKVIPNTNPDNLLNSDGKCDIELMVSKDFSFAVTLKNNISSVKVMDENNNTIRVEMTSDFDVTYINAPRIGYNENTLYKVYIKNGRFLKEEYNKYNDLCFRVGSEN